jgi:hypothetical protein
LIRGKSEGMSALLAELWRHGGRIIEMLSKASSLEELYMNHAGQDNWGAIGAVILSFELMIIQLRMKVLVELRPAEPPQFPAFDTAR